MNDTDQSGYEWEITMPYGKYAGMRMSEIPTDYLEWLVNNGHHAQHLVSEALRVIAARSGAKYAPQVVQAKLIKGVEEDKVEAPRLPPNFSAIFALRMVERGRRALSAEHPQGEAYNSIQATADWLSSVLEVLMPQEAQPSAPSTETKSTNQ